tara:strand:+ start:2639 stop:2830 length:192 start_codon:yes stop_codon:yes gene_type:complete
MNDKLDTLIKNIPDIKEIIIQQNQDIEDMSKELLGVKMSDTIVNKVIEQELTKEVIKRIMEAF